MSEHSAKGQNGPPTREELQSLDLELGQLIKAIKERHETRGTELDGELDDVYDLVADTLASWSLRQKAIAY